MREPDSTVFMTMRLSRQLHVWFVLFFRDWMYFKDLIKQASSSQRSVYPPDNHYLVEVWAIILTGTCLFVQIVPMKGIYKF